MNFPIGDRASERMPLPVIKAFGVLKKSAAQANQEFGLGMSLHNVCVLFLKYVRDQTNM